MKKLRLKTILAFFIFWSFTSVQTFAETNGNLLPRILTINEFVKTAVKNDDAFEKILIEELSLKYKKDLALPAKDLVLSVKNQYEFFLNQDRNEPRMSLSLSKLFPYTGSEVSAEYGVSPYSSLKGVNSEINFYVSQPIAKNAFGKATSIQDKITGFEIEISRYQITEAYEDYLAFVTAAYYNWYFAYENLKIGRSSYDQSLKLLENIKKRWQSNIALPVDVNKVKIQVLIKKEELLRLKQEYDNILNFIKQSARYDDDIEIEPSAPFEYGQSEVSFDKEYKQFADSSRTYGILTLLEKKDSLNIDKYADSLLPSTNLLLGYQIDGEDFGVKGTDGVLYAGMSLNWLFGNQKNRAGHETAKISLKSTKISNKNKYVQLRTDLKNLFVQIEKEKKLIVTGDEKIKLSNLILKDETVNYSYGKVSLNDLIEAVNRIDENKFNKLSHLINHRILITEWLRLTDRLVSRKKIFLGK